MLTVRNMVLAALAAAGLTIPASSARADGFGLGAGPGMVPGHASPFKNNPNYPAFRPSLFGPRQPLPVFQAAPWYLYWPYDAHFLTPAPVTGAFYGPPAPGNFPVNPYFPPPYGNPYGPIPGGPAPGGIAPPPPGGFPGPTPR